MEKVILDSGELGVLKRVIPDHPKKARSLGITGYVELRLIISTAGYVEKIEIIQERPQGYGFALEAIKAIKQWKFTAPTFKGIPVRAYRRLRVNFD